MINYIKINVKTIAIKIQTKQIDILVWFEYLKYSVNSMKLPINIKYYKNTI